MIHAHRTSVAAALAAFLLLAAPGAASAGGEAARTAAVADPAMPAMLRLALARSQAADVAAAYYVDRDGRGANPRHGLELAFTPAGVRIEGGDGGFALRLERFGRGAGRPVRRATPRIDSAWVEYDRGAGLTEWFVNLPGGVEQGWTVTERPAGGGLLMLELDTVRPPDDKGDQRLSWSGLVYHRLLALDADGRELSAAWTHDGARLRIEVDDHDAAYPLLIDPWIEQAKLTAADGAAFDSFGRSVALAGDTALVGAPGPTEEGDSVQGAAYVFTRSGDTWSQQDKLTANDGAEGDFFGESVALTGDTALVGAPFAQVGEDQGAAYVFTRSGDTWSQQDKLTADDGAAGDWFGLWVALADDTALVGARFAAVDGNAEQGAAYVFSPELSFAPVALAVDPPGLAPEANGVFEPGEAVDVAPAWRNDGDLAASLAGTASSFTGPAGATYSIDLDAADYGLIEPGATAGCLDTEVCYRLGLDDPAARPATHWDATFLETLDDPDGTGKTWTLHLGDSFIDVPRANQFYRSIETLLHHGVSGDPALARLQLPLLGCAETEFCPAASVTRGEAAVFLLKGLEGGTFDPPDCDSDSERFDDVPAEDPFCPWIEELARRQVTAGCGGGNYCPDAAVTRAQIAVLLLKTLEGPDHVPPECEGVFDDVTCPSLFADWIEDLFVRGITAGCGGSNYCPNQPITRAQMAAFVARTFGLVLYGP